MDRWVSSTLVVSQSKKLRNSNRPYLLSVVKRNGNIDEDIAHRIKSKIGEREADHRFSLQ